jgi:chromosome segregation ATPase
VVAWLEEEVRQYERDLEEYARIKEILEATRRDTAQSGQRYQEDHQRSAHPETQISIEDKEIEELEREVNRLDGWVEELGAQLAEGTAQLKRDEAKNAELKQRVRKLKDKIGTCFACQWSTRSGCELTRTRYRFPLRV